MNRTKIIEHYKKFMQLDKMQEDYQIDIDWMQAFIEDNNLVNKNDLLPLVSNNEVAVCLRVNQCQFGNTVQCDPKECNIYKPKQTES